MAWKNKEDEKKYYETNKEKLKERSRLWYQNNREKAMNRLKVTNKIWASKNRDKVNKRIKAYRKRWPWAKLYLTIYRRCRYSPHYVKHGIKMRITTAELRALWIRDRASEMKNPSIDRIDRNGDYTFENCQFLEIGDNLKRRTFYRLKNDQS